MVLGTDALWEWQPSKKNKEEVRWETKIRTKARRAAPSNLCSFKKKKTLKLPASFFFIDHKFMVTFRVPYKSIHNL